MINPVMEKKTLLEEWMGKKIRIQTGNLTRQQLSQYQLIALGETIRRAYENSPFYHTLLKDCADIEMNSLGDLQRFPFTTADHIREHGMRFLCVSQSDIHRIVTLHTSGTTGEAKRIYFTASDQELTVDFFQQGMSTMVKPGERVLILLPGERSGSVGDLLTIALKRARTQPIIHGVVENVAETLDIMVQEKIDSVVGIPVQVLALARYSEFAHIKIQVKSVLMSTDHVPDAITREVRRIWNCQVFEHYGMTEMGLGGGLDCEVHSGYHLREADLYFEIIDDSGNPVPDGEEGEVVFTTLTRQGMPLIRYRTGDISRFLIESCLCGTVLRRLERITKRKNNLVFLSEEQYFTIADLDEEIFSVPGVIDYKVYVDSLQLVREMNVSVWMLGEPDQESEFTLYERIKRIAVIQRAERNGKLSILVNVIFKTTAFLTSPVKRRVMELKDDGRK